MKKIFNKIFILISFVFLTSSCLTNGLEKLENFDSKDITGIVGVYHRYLGQPDDIIPGTGEVHVYQKPLQCLKSEIDSEKGLAFFEVKVVPEYLPALEVSKVSISKLVVVLSVSLASVIQPVEGNAILGVPADWSRPNKYIITAADGSKKNWTVELKLVQ